MSLRTSAFQGCCVAGVCRLVWEKGRIEGFREYKVTYLGEMEKDIIFIKWILTYVLGMSVFPNK